MEPRYKSLASQIARPPQAEGARVPRTAISVIRNRRKPLADPRTFKGGAMRKFLPRGV